jgi:hypothetical protein
MATRFYLHNVSAPYTPATIRGAWDATASAVVKALDTAIRPTHAITYVSIAETSTTDEWDVLLGRFVSGPLKAGTIGTGTVDVMLGVYENNAAANDHYHLHIFVTAGDTDTVRGTLLTNYREAAGVNEWGTATATSGRALNAAQSLSSVVVSDGDRIVVEIGYTARNTSATSYNARVYYGVGTDVTAADLTASGDGTTYRGYIQFSETFDFTTTARVSQGPTEVAIDEDTSPAARVSQGSIDVAIDEDTSPAVRATQVPIDVAIISTNDAQRVTQLGAEYVNVNDAELRTTHLGIEYIAPAVVASRLTQLGIEYVMPNTVESRLSQLGMELTDAGTRALNVTQFGIEILGRSASYCGDPNVNFTTLCGKTDVVTWLDWTVTGRVGLGV